MNAKIALNDIYPNRFKFISNILYNWYSIYTLKTLSIIVSKDKLLDPFKYKMSFLDTYDFKYSSNKSFFLKYFLMIFELLIQSKVSDIKSPYSIPV